METNSPAAMRLLVALAAVAVWASGAGGAATVSPARKPETAPKKTTYAIARTTGRPYRCTYQLGFAGGYDDFTADILGDDFLTVPLVWKPKFDSKGIPTQLPPSASWLNYARKGSTGYTWPCNLEDPPAPVVDGCRFDLARIKAETGESPGNWFFFAAPEDDGSCERIDAVTIAIPSLTFADRTQMLIDVFREGQDKTEAP